MQKSIRKIVGLSAGAVFVLLAILVAGIPFFLESGVFQSFLQEKINQTIPGRLTWGDTDLQVTAGRLSLQDIRLEGAGGDKLVSLGLVAADLDWAALFRGQVRLTSIRVSATEISLALSETGELNLISALVAPDAEAESATPAGGTGPPLNLVIDDLAVDVRSLAVATPSGTVSLSGMDLSVTGVDLLKQTAALRIRIGQGTASLPDRTYPLGRFQTDMQWAADRIDVGQLAMETEGVKLAVQGGIDDLFGKRMVDLSADVRVAAETACREMNLPAVATGTATLTLSVKGAADNPEAGLNLRYGPGTIGEWPVSELFFSTVLADKKLTLQPSRLVSEAGRLTLDGTADMGTVFPGGFTRGITDLNQLAYSLNLEMADLLPGSIPPLGKDWSGRISSRVAVSGSGVLPGGIAARVTADLDASALSGPGIEAPLDLSFRSRAGLNGERADLETLTVNAPGLKVSGSGTLDLPGFDPEKAVVDAALHLDVENLGLVKQVAGLDVAGSGRVDLRARGLLRQPDVHLAAGAENISLAPYHADRFALDTRLSRSGDLAVEQAVVETAGGRVSVSGKVGLMAAGWALKPDPSLDMGLEIADIRLGDLLAEQGIDGLVSGRANVGGTVRKPNASATLAASGLAAGETAIDALDADIRFQDGLLTLTDTRVQRRESRVDVTGKVRLMAPGTTDMLTAPLLDLAVTGDTVQLADFWADGTGQIDLSATVTGPSDRPEGAVSLNGKDMTIQRQPLERIRLEADLADQRLVIRQCLARVGEGAELAAFGEIGLDDRQVAVRVTAPDFDLSLIDAATSTGLKAGRLGADISASGSLDAPDLKGQISVSDVALEGQPGMSGSLAASFDCQGPLAQPEQITASARISQLNLSRSGQMLVRVKDAEAQLAGGRFSLSETRAELLAGGHLTAKGTGALDGNLDVDIQGRIPLTVATPLVDAIRDASGDIRLAASVTGSMAAPQFQADISFDDLGLGIDPLAEELHGISGRIRVTPAAVEIESITGKLGDGSLEIGGRADMAEGGPPSWDLVFSGNQLALDLPDLMEMSLNSRLTFKGTPDASEVAGEVVLLEGRYYRDVELDLMNLATKRTRQTAPAKETTGPSFLNTVGLNIYVGRRDPFLVDNNMAYLTVSPDLTVRGTAQAPVLSGRTLVESGTITFQQAEFEVTKGVIDFINPYRIEPEIDVAAETDIRTWKVYLTATGTPEDLSLSLTSDPTETQADILSLIAMGKTSRELGGSSGVSGAGVAAGLLADPVAKNLKQATGLDKVEIEMDEDEDTGEQGVKVSLGADLSRQMSVAYGVDIRDGETVQKVTTYYKLLEHLLMSGFQDTGGRFGGELKYRLEFR